MSDVSSIGRLNHIAIVVPDLKVASELYARTFGATVSAVQDLPEHGVSIVFVMLPNTKIELMTPFGAHSPIRAFLEKNASGGLHHVCYEVSDIGLARDRLLSAGLRILGSGEPTIGAHGQPVLFLHPKDALGTLIELEQAVT